MPTILLAFGLRFYFYSDEHLLIHVHVENADGKVWTGWRLPTRDEVGVILRYQNAGYDTMSPVLTGGYYWTLEGAAVSTGVFQYNDTDYLYDNWNTRYSNTNYDYTAGTDYMTIDGWRRSQTRRTYIRCIRDLSPSEVNEINAKIGHEND